MQYKNVAMEIIEKLNLLEEALDAPTELPKMSIRAFLLISIKRHEQSRQASSVAKNSR